MPVVIFLEEVVVLRFLAVSSAFSGALTMTSSNSIYLSVIVSLVVLLVAGFIWLTRPIPTVAANDLIKLKTVGTVTNPENIFSGQATLNAESDLVLPLTLPSKQPLLQLSEADLAVAKSDEVDPVLVEEVLLGEQ